MPKEDHVKITGKVIDVLPGDFFKIEVDGKTEPKTETTARLSGKMRHNKIQILLGDKVEVSFSPYDLKNGMITRRL